MNRIIFISVGILLLANMSLIAQRQDIRLKQSNVSGIYKKGGKITVVAYTGNMTGDSLNVKVLKNNRNLLMKKATLINSDSLIVFEGSYGEPCSIIIEVSVKEKSSVIGLIVEPKQLKPGIDRPKDFDAYWNSQKKSLKALKMNVKTSPIPDTLNVKGYSCENVEINCLGPKPARGYFAKPQKALPGSLPAVLLVHAAGVKGSWCRSEPKNAIEYARKGTLCFDLNAHGMLNGQPESYYADLEAGELKDYYRLGVTSSDDFYFRGMYLRLLRTIEFLTQQPEWDGKRILVIGESQGGGQALVAAGLDKRVSAVVAIVPAMCDWFGSQVERMSGWPQLYETNASKPEMQKTLPYFDAANILKGSKATIFTEIGLIDMTCPATSVYTAVNQSKGKKLIYAVPYRQHHQPDNILTKTWVETIYKPRESFITDYLK